MPQIPTQTLAQPEAAPEVAGENPARRNLAMGQRVKALRAERGFTIAELAARAGVSVGLISQIERGNSNPSMSTLEKLRDALGANFWEFRDPMPAPDDSPYVRRANKRPKVTVGTNGFSKELLSPRNNNEMRFMILTLPEGAHSTSVLNGPGDKGGYVLEGRVQLSIEGEVTTLFPGDSFQFPSTALHRVENTAPETARLLWIISIRDAHF